MEIKDVQPNQGNLDLVLTITEKGDARTFEKFGKSGSVCSAKAKDESGEIKLTLWNEDIDKIRVGDKIHLKNGWCSEYQGERQLSSGKFGTIEVLESQGASAGGQQDVVTNDPAILGQQGLAEPSLDGDTEPIQEEESVE